jgi:DNA-binding transcriptional MerR regulator
MLANEEVRFFNRRYYHRNAVNKLETLITAKKIGFNVSETFFANDLANHDSAETSRAGGMYLPSWK